MSSGNKYRKILGLNDRKPLYLGYLVILFCKNQFQFFCLFYQLFSMNLKILSQLFRILERTVKLATRSFP